MGERHRAKGVERRRHRVAVYLDSVELAQLRESAALTRLAAGVFLRRVGLGYQPKTRLDHERVRDLIRVRGDLGRVGGLLKLWLTERPGEGAAVADVRAVLNEIEQIADELRGKVRQL